MSSFTKSVLDIPELAALVCSFSRPQDAARLGLTNRRLFEIAMPVAWNHVDCVASILKLVKGCTLSISNTEDGEVTHINLPMSISNNELTRLYVYAPLIRSLDIFGLQDNDLQYAITNAPVLLVYTERNELLPNLQRLTMNTGEGWKIAYYFWFKIFASRSLLEVRPIVSAYGVLPSISLPTISSLIRYATQKCPLLETLGIFAIEGFPNSFDHELEHLIFESNEEPLAHILAEASALVNVSGNPILFDSDIFAALGQLPMLARFECFYTSDLNEEDSPLVPAREAVDGSFSSLRHFALHNAYLEHVVSAWKMSPLVRRLTTIEINFNSDLTPSGEPWIRDSFIPLICKGSPQITSLIISFQCGYGEVPGQPFVFRLTKENLAALAALPLSKLEISKTMLDFDDSVKAVAMAWPAMETLKLLAQQVQFDDLYHFARHMPRLRHLQIDIQMTSLPQAIHLDSMIEVSRPVLQMLESGFYGLHEFSPEQVCKLYRYLKTLYPNARLVGLPRTSVDISPSRSNDFALAATLNEVSSMAYFSEKCFKVSGPISIEEAIVALWKAKDTICSQVQTLLEMDPRFQRFLRATA